MEPRLQPRTLNPVQHAFTHARSGRERAIRREAQQHLLADVALAVVAALGHAALHVLAVRDLEWVQADGATLWLHTAHRAWALRERMGEMETRLAPHGFTRVHRSSLVRVSAIASLSVGADGEHVVTLRSGGKVRVARDRVGSVRDAIASLASSPPRDGE